MELKKIYLVLMLTVALSGCASFGYVKIAGTSKATEVAKNLFDDALFIFCKGSPIGIVENWVGSNQELADARKTVCSKDAQADVVMLAEFYLAVE